MRISNAVGLTLCVVAAGCGTSHTLVAPASVSTGRAATAAGNRAAARAEADRLLSLAQAPPGAVRLARPPSPLTGPSMGNPAVSSLVDKALSWRVDLPFAAAKTWLTAHRPRSLRQDGSTSSGNAFTGQTTMIGTSYRGPANRAWQSAELEIGLAPAGSHASVIRADAVIVWLDPRPVRSSPGAHPVRVTISGGCPPSDKGVTGVTNPGARLTRRLLPAGKPTGGLRCRYDGLNGHPWQLVAARRLTAGQARQKARSLARIPLSHPDGAVVNCPMDDGSAEVLVLVYPGRPDVDLWIKLNGCGGTSNGSIIAGSL